MTIAPSASSTKKKGARPKAAAAVPGAAPTPTGSQADFNAFITDARALPNAEVTEILSGMDPLPDGWPEAFAAAVVGFLSRVVPGVGR